MEVNATEDKDKLLISDPLAYLLEAGFSLEDIERERDHAGISIADQAEAVRRIEERERIRWKAARNRRRSRQSPPTCFTCSTPFASSRKKRQHG